MTRDKEYQGHRNWNTWNVGLWIGNDEGLYELAKGCIKSHRSRKEAAKAMLATLNDAGVTKTPDGAPYTVAAILAALRGL